MLGRIVSKQHMAICANKAWQFGASECLPLRKVREDRGLCSGIDAQAIQTRSPGQITQLLRIMDIAARGNPFENCVNERIQAVRPLAGNPLNCGQGQSLGGGLLGRRGAGGHAARCRSHFSCAQQLPLVQVGGIREVEIPVHGSPYRNHRVYVSIGGSLQVDTHCHNVHLIFTGPAIGCQSRMASPTPDRSEPGNFNAKRRSVNA